VQQRSSSSSSRQHCTGAVQQQAALLLEHHLASSLCPWRLLDQSRNLHHLYIRLSRRYSKSMQLPLGRASHQCTALYIPPLQFIEPLQMVELAPPLPFAPRVPHKSTCLKHAWAISYLGTSYLIPPQSATRKPAVCHPQRKGGRPRPPHRWEAAAASASLGGSRGLRIAGGQPRPPHRCPGQPAYLGRRGASVVKLASQHRLHL
jgi:hypothetical protein